MLFPPTASLKSPMLFSPIHTFYLVSIWCQRCGIRTKIASITPSASTEKNFTQCSRTCGPTLFGKSEFSLIWYTALKIFPSQAPDVNFRSLGTQCTALYRLHFKKQNLIKPQTSTKNTHSHRYNFTCIKDSLDGKKDQVKTKVNGIT